MPVRRSTAGAPRPAVVVQALAAPGRRSVEYVGVCFAAAASALLTLFSGFGLGTLLLPVFAVFFPAHVAVAATAVVHLANNLFKLAILGRHARRRVVLRFGLPAALFAFGGAWVLERLTHLPATGQWTAGAHVFTITPLQIVMGILIALFAIVELVPAFEHLQFAPRWLPLGGALSGFFGGISGHQGALRAAFLARSGLDRDAFLGTSVACAVLVDVARISVYGATFGRHLDAVTQDGGVRLVVAATGAAFVGSFAGTRLVKKMTLRLLQRCVGIGLLLLAAALALGLV